MKSDINEALPLRKISSTFKLKFIVQRKVSYGRGLYLVGNLPELGNWNPDFAVKLFWVEGDHWTQTVTVKLPSNQETKVQYKFIETDYARIKKTDLVWEEGPNRLIIINGSQSTSSSKAELDTLKNSYKDFNICSLGKAPSLVQSFDCDSKTLEDLKWLIESASSAEFIALQNVACPKLREVLPMLPYHMVYFAEDCTGIIYPIMYKFCHWHLVKARTITKDHNNVGSSVTFSNGDLTFTICNGQSKDLFFQELERHQDKQGDFKQSAVSKDFILSLTPNTGEQLLSRDGQSCLSGKVSDRKTCSPATSPPHLNNLQSFGSS